VWYPAHALLGFPPESPAPSKSPAVGFVAL